MRLSDGHGDRWLSRLCRCDFFGGEARAEKGLARAEKAMR
jgi:hypothetical protein